MGFFSSVGKKIGMFNLKNVKLATIISCFKPALCNVFHVQLFCYRVCFSKQSLKGVIHNPHAYLLRIIHIYCVKAFVEPLSVGFFHL